MNRIILFIFSFSVVTCVFGETSKAFTVLSPDNPVLELIDAELSGDKDSMYKALRIIDTLISNYKNRISTLSDKSSELITIEEQFNIFYSIGDSSIPVFFNQEIRDDLLIAYMYAAYYYFVTKEYKKAAAIAQKAIEIAPEEKKQDYELIYENLIMQIQYEYEKGEE
jgi:tetratricopeptide (TPR) repeat protein